jgi:outer membrane biosynthesis protein TonB
MAQQTGSKKILRIGVILAGKVVEERLIRKHASVTFGTDGKNTFVFESDAIEKSWPLFEVKGNNYSLVFNEKMTGSVSVDGKSIDFGSLSAQNLVQKQGAQLRYTLNDSSRGRVQFGGGYTILFTFVPAPPVTAKPAMPLAAKGGWVKSIEPVFTSLLAGSFLLHALLTVAVFNVEPPPPPSMDDVKALIARVTPPKIEAPPPPKAETAKDEGKSEKKAAKKKAPKKEEKAEAPKKAKKAPAKKQSAADRARAAEAKRKEVQSKIAGQGLLGLIGSADGAGDSSVADVFGSGSSVGSLSTDLSGTAGVGVAGSGAGITRRGSGGGGGSAAGIGDLKAGGGGSVSTGGKKKAKVRPKVRAASISDMDGEIDKKGVSRKLRSRGKAFQKCYETALKTNSKLKGKLVVEFTINEKGKVAGADVVKDGLGSSAVSKCVVGVLKRIRFPKPDDGEVTITNSFVFTSGG